MRNWKKIIVSVLLLCAVPGYLCAGTNDSKVLRRVVNYLEKGQVKELEKYWNGLLPENNGRNPYHVLDKALTQRYTNRFKVTPFEFNYEHYKKFYNTYKGTWLQSEVEYIMMGGDSNGWLHRYFHSNGSKYLDLGEGLYIRAYLKKHLGIDTKGMLLEHDVRYPNLIYFELSAWQLKAILKGAEAMAAGLGDSDLYRQVKHNIFFNYLNYDTYEREGLKKEFVRTLQLLGAETDSAWQVLQTKPVTQKMQSNAMKLYSRCYDEKGLHKAVCKNFRRYAKKYGVWMTVPPLPTPQRRSTGIL